MFVRNTHEKFSLVIIVFALLLVFPAYANSTTHSTVKPTAVVGKTYYVDGNLLQNCIANYSLQNRDCSGNDGFAYRTFQQGADVLQAGDTLIVRKGIYREGLVLKKSGASLASKITIKSYANELVVINAADLVGNWQRCTSLFDCQGNPNWQNIHYAVPGFPVQQLFQNGSLLSPSRFPNEGWQYPNAVGPNAQLEFTDSSLNKPDAYFNEAEANIKTTAYWISNIPVRQSSASGYIQLEKEVEGFKGPISLDYGYFFTNIVEEINEPGEWAYDENSGRLYLWSKGNLDAVEASRRDFGIKIDNTQYYEVLGISVRNSNSYGIWIHGSDNNRIENCKIDYSYGFGVFVQGGFSGRGTANNNIINKNTIKFSNYRGITNDAQSDNIQITNNFVYATGAKQYGDDLLNGVGEGIFVEGDFAKVLNNIVDRTGYTSIYVFGKQRSGKIIAYNIINNSNLSLTDGGGIYGGGKSDSGMHDEIHHNIVQNVYGYIGGIKDASSCDIVKDVNSCAKGASGIYIDEQGNNFIIRDNTVVNSYEAGIFFHWTKNNFAEKNVLYNNHKQMWLSGNNEPRFTLESNNLSNNIMFSTSPDQLTFFLGINYSDINFGYSDFNYFYNPYASNIIRAQRYVNQNGQTKVLDDTLSIEAWRNLSGKETNSKVLTNIFSTAHSNNETINDSMIFLNSSMTEREFKLDSSYCGLDGELVSGSMTVAPFKAKILLKCFCNNDMICNNSENRGTCPSDC